MRCRIGEAKGAEIAAEDGENFENYLTEALETHLKLGVLPCIWVLVTVGLTSHPSIVTLLRLSRS